MTWLNKSWKKGTKKTSFETKWKKQTVQRDSILSNKTNSVRKSVIPFLVTYSPALPNIREIIKKLWDILNINNTFRIVFRATLVTTFSKNISLRQIIGTNTTRYYQKLLKVKQNVTKGECIPCNTSRCLSCQQIIAATTFESTQRKEKFHIYHNISCKSNNVIYLLHCTLCKMQYVRKSEANFHINKIDQPQKGYKNS